MGRYKKYKPPFEDRNAAGEKICVMCGKPLTGRQERWCGGRKCLQAQWIRSGDQTEMRVYLFKKEKGICQGCGMDCEMLRKVIEWVVENRDSESEEEEMILYQLVDLGLPIKITGDEDNRGFVTWEADHIVPLAEGGEHHEDNIQTLCITCHKKDTRELAGRLARKRKKEATGTNEMFPEMQ